MHSRPYSAFRSPLAGSREKFGRERDLGLWAPVARRVRLAFGSAELGHLLKNALQ